MLPLSLQRWVVEKRAQQESWRTQDDVGSHLKGCIGSEENESCGEKVIAHCQHCATWKGRPLTKEALAPNKRPTELGGRWHIDDLAMPDSEGWDDVMVA